LVCKEAHLLFEEIFKRLARVGGTGGSGRGGRICGIGHRRRVLLDGHAELKERTIVFRVLLGNAFEDGLRAFKLPAGIEMDALLAGMERSMASRALAILVKARGKDGAAAGAAGPHHGANHPRGARAEHVLVLGPGFWRTFGAFALFVIRVAVAIALYFVFSIH
jgi:hypothetical protein